MSTPSQRKYILNDNNIYFLCFLLPYDFLEISLHKLSLREGKKIKWNKNKQTNKQINVIIKKIGLLLVSQIIFLK